MLADEVIILAPANEVESRKGDFLEDLMSRLMARQRYRVVQRINFTGTEIDLLCEHRDRPNDTALLECKAREDISSTDLKTFAYDVLVGKANIGFFVHTSQLRHQAAGIVKEWQQANRDNLLVWGPEKIGELLLDAGEIVEPAHYVLPSGERPAKLLLVISRGGRFWLRLLAAGIEPTHYLVFDASNGQPLRGDAATAIGNLVPDTTSGLEVIGAETLSVRPGEPPAEGVPIPDGSTEDLEAEEGFLDFACQGLEALQRTTQFFVALTEDTKPLTELMETAGIEVQRLQQSGTPNSLKEIRTLALRVAAGMNAYSLKLESRLPDLEDSVQEQFRNTTGWVELAQPSSEEEFQVLRGLRGAVSYSMDQSRSHVEATEGFRESVSGLRQARVSKAISAASHRLCGNLDRVIATLREVQPLGTHLVGAIDGKLAPG